MYASLFQLDEGGLTIVCFYHVKTGAAERHGDGRPDPDGIIHIESAGECWGTILQEYRGQGGFGYDPLFEIGEYHQTFAEMGVAVKRAISHRARSLRGFLRKLDEAIWLSDSELV